MDSFPNEAPGFDFNVYELTRWRIVDIWAARSGSEADRERLRDNWRRDVVTFRKWAYRAWATQRCHPTKNRRYQSLTVSYGERMDFGAIRRGYPELIEQYRNKGELAVFQRAGCTPAQCEALAMWHSGKSHREVADALGIHVKSAQQRLTAGTGKLRALGISLARQIPVSTEGEISD